MEAIRYNDDTRGELSSKNEDFNENIPSDYLELLSTLLFLELNIFVQLYILWMNMSTVV